MNWYELHCFGSTTTQLAHQHVRFWTGPCKGPIGTSKCKNSRKAGHKVSRVQSQRNKTVSDSKKHIKVGSQKVYDTSVIYSRVIGIQASSRDIDIKKVLNHELAPVPLSMFHDSGAMRIGKAKSDLKKRLVKKASSRCSTSNVTASVLCCSVGCPVGFP